MPPKRLIATCLLGLLFLAGILQAGSKFNRVIEVGKSGPDFRDLQGIDGKKHSLSDYRSAKLVVVIFLKNTCPIAKRYIDRIREFSQKYQPQGIRLIAINVSREPGESLEKMRSHFREAKLDLDYLKDESQQTGRNYGATNTPHVFVLDPQRKIAYMGAIDDSNSPENVTENYLIAAVDALLKGNQVEIPETLQRGCQIDYVDE